MAEQTSRTLLPILALAALAACARPPETGPAPEPEPGASISSFEECVAAGHPVMESWPPQCRVPGGATFTQDIGNELEKQDLIRIETPRPGTVVTSPLTVRGQARGFWFFEADFPVVLEDADGRQVAIAVASARGEWMTEDFVPFEATLEFQPPATPSGRLVLKKNNPSDLRERDDELVVPVRF